MRTFLDWGVSGWVAVALIAGAGAAAAGDPILFFSTDQISSAPVKDFDRELVKIIEAPDAVTPTQAAYDATARERRGPRRSDARRMALLNKRRQAEANWLVDESSDGGESSGELGGAGSDGEGIDEIEILYGPGEPELEGAWDTTFVGGSSGVDQAEQARMARMRASRAAAQTEAARADAMDLSGQLDLKSLMASDSAATPQAGIRGGGGTLSGGSVLDATLPSRTDFSAPGGFLVPGRFQPRVQTPNFSGGPSISLRDRLGAGLTGGDRSAALPNRATHTDWSRGGGLNGLEQRYRRAAEEDQRVPAAPEHEKWRRLGR